jgi:hypothetical protein
VTRARKITVHWTAHSCLVADPTALVNRSSWACAFQVSGTWFGCETDRRKPLDPTRNRYSVSIDDVTCDRCHTRHAKLLTFWTDTRRFDNATRTILDPISPVDVILAAHGRCCAGRGAPLAIGRDVLIGEQRRRAAYSLGKEANHAIRCLSGLTLDGDDSAKHVNALAGWLPQELAAIARPAIDHMAMAAELIDTARGMLASAESTFAAIAGQIERGELAAPRALLPSTIPGEPGHVSDRQGGG